MLGYIQHSSWRIEQLRTLMRMGIDRNSLGLSVGLGWSCILSHEVIQSSDAHTCTLYFTHSASRDQYKC